MTEQNILDKIMAHKREEVARQRIKLPYDELRREAESAPPARSFEAALRRPGRLALIAEVKRASPSRGVLVENFDHLALARAYAENGAAAISVLTDVRFFQGSLQYLRAIRQALDGQQVPLLRKDFLCDVYQVAEARAYGADALLLIVAALNDDELSTLLAETARWGMQALVEVHDEQELERALAAGATLIGVNNRDLKTFQVDLETTRRVAARLPAATARPLLVAESGIFGPDDLAKLRAWQADAILVGEALVTAADVGAKVRELAGAITESD